MQTGSLPQSVRQWQGQLEHLHQRCASSVGRDGQVGVHERVCQTMPYLLLNWLIFLFNLLRVGLAWHTIGIYHSAISAFLEPSLSSQGLQSSCHL